MIRGRDLTTPTRRWRRGLPLLALGLAACGAASIPSAPLNEEGATTGASGLGDAEELAEVGHERELRGLWVTTVSNLDWPSRPGLDVTTQQAELVAMLDTMEGLQLNTVLFQVRPEGDALYASELEPWSAYLTGRQGEDPGWDPLAFLIEEAHARNIEVHAWFNPYRAGTAAAASRMDDAHMGRTFAEHLHRYGDLLWMDPGAPEVQDRAVEVVLDVAQRYDIDGVHLDDYFYPYPNGRPFPDDRTWADYQASGGELTRDDWRRQNVHTVVQRISEELAEVRPDVRFGISPFGIYRPGTPEGVRGLDQYAEIFADPVHWMEQGWVHYLTPQLYWPTTANGQGFETLLRWWGGLAEEGRQVYAGHALYRLGERGWDLEELRTQVRLTREVDGSAGQMWFRAGNLLDRPEVEALLGEELYATPALTPPLPDAEGRSVAAPAVRVDGDTVALEHPDQEALRAWAVYRWQDGGWVLDRVRSATTGALQLESGRWAVSAVDRHGVESAGAVVVL